VQHIVINGLRELKGEIDVQGSKNSSLPILAATVLVKGVSVIHNCPDLSDVRAAVSILEHLGCSVKRENNTLTVDSSGILCYNIPDALMREMRSSIVFLGSVLGRTGKAVLSSPGGCEIGLRPIDLHLSSLRSLGVTIDESHGEINCSLEKQISGGVISLSFPSVGATENIILACCLSKGRTVILNAAREPEIKDLADFLNLCGGRISIGTHGTVIIDGVSELHSAEHRVIPDRIVALTYMSAVASTKGQVTLKNVDTSAFMSALPLFESMGCEIKDQRNILTIKMNKRPKAIRDIRTMPYPGFPTDAQAPVMAVLTKGEGTSIVVENIFESRYKHVPELMRMGAKIKIESKVALIDGSENLYGAAVTSPDLRGGAALVIAALGAEGETVIDGLGHIDRGYENIENTLSALGADIKRIST
jgi:UDP-N-acetylglucosamine 1-carboxyvinyltransferase